MKNIIIFGASDHCGYTIDIVENEKRYNIIGVLDKKAIKNSLIHDYPILGYLDDLEDLILSNDIYGGIIAIGDNHTRMTLANEILSICPDFKFVNAIHSSVIIGKNSIIGDGCVFMAGVIINNNCQVGNHCFLATRSSLDHDSIMNNFSSFSPGVTSGGRVFVGKCTAVGIGATILHYIKIGDNCVIGGNSLVNKDISNDVLAYGVPIRVIRDREVNEKYL